MVPEVASLAAETGLAVFRVASKRWTSGGDDADLAALMRTTLADLAHLSPS